MDVSALDNKWITGWKAIAAHLGISVSTVKRRVSVRRLPTGRPIVLPGDEAEGKNNHQRVEQMAKKLRG
jgi:hypothetical protein